MLYLGKQCKMLASQSQHSSALSPLSIPSGEEPLNLSTPSRQYLNHEVIATAGSSSSNELLLSSDISRPTMPWQDIMNVSTTNSVDVTTGAGSSSSTRAWSIDNSYSASHNEGYRSNIVCSTDVDKAKVRIWNPALDLMQKSSDQEQHAQERILGCQALIDQASSLPWPGAVMRRQQGACIKTPPLGFQRPSVDYPAAAWSLVTPVFTRISYC